MIEVRTCRKCEQEKGVEGFKVNKLGSGRVCLDCYNRDQRLKYSQSEEIRKRVVDYARIRYNTDAEYRERFREKRNIYQRARWKNASAEYKRNAMQKIATYQKNRYWSDEKWRQKLNARHWEIEKIKRATDTEFRNKANLRCREFRARLPESYIKFLMGVPLKARIPSEMLEAKRIQLRIYRFLKEKQ